MVLVLLRYVHCVKYWVLFYFTEGYKMEPEKFTCKRAWFNPSGVVTSVLLENRTGKVARLETPVVVAALRRGAVIINNLAVDRSGKIIVNERVKRGHECKHRSNTKYTFNEMLMLYKRFMPRDMQIEVEVYDDDSMYEKTVGIRFMGGFKYWYNAYEEEEYGETMDICDADSLRKEGEIYISKQLDKFYEAYGIHLELANWSEKGWSIWAFIQ